MEEGERSRRRWRCLRGDLLLDLRRRRRSRKRDLAVGGIRGMCREGGGERRRGGEGSPFGWDALSTVWEGRKERASSKETRRSCLFFIFTPHFRELPPRETCRVNRHSCDFVLMQIDPKNREITRARTSEGRRPVSSSSSTSFPFFLSLDGQHLRHPHPARINRM